MSEAKGLHIQVCIEGTDASPDQTVSVFETVGSDGSLVVPVNGLIKALRNSSDNWRDQSLLIQATGLSESDDEPDVLLAADNRIEINRQARQHRTAIVDEQQVELTKCEYNLLEFLLSNLDTVLQRPDIYESVWGQSFRREDRTVDVYVNKLRNKLSDISDDLGDREHGFIRSRFGIGYIALSTLNNS